MLLSSKRIGLEKGDILELESYDSQEQLIKQKIVIEEQIGEGASCLSYLVRAYIDHENSRRMVLKEFYPDPYMTNLHIIRDPETKKLLVNIPENSAQSRSYEKLKQEFQNAFVLQNSLSDARSGEAMVKPYKLAKFGGSIYILSDIFTGKIMSGCEMSTLEDKLTYMGRLTEAVALIHDQGYYCVDLHPGNVLCIDAPKLVKLFDVDSLIRTDGSNLNDSLKMTLPYGAPEIRRIRNTGITKSWVSRYLTPRLDIYPLGIMMFELLFGRLPLEEDIQSLKSSSLLAEELCEKENLKKDTIVTRIRSVLLRSMNENFYVRFINARQMYDEINLILKEIGSLPFIPKKKIAEANYTFFSYHLLEKFPIYHYAGEENGRRKLDVAIVGSHEMRNQMLKTVLPCAQMLNTDLSIRIIAKDAEAFWEKFTDSGENPDLACAIVCHRPGQKADETIDTNLTDKKLADIWLYPYSENGEIARVIKETNSGYVLLFGEEEENQKLKEALISGNEAGHRMFVGYLTARDQEDAVHTPVDPKVDCYAMGMKRVTEEYNEALFKSRIYKMGFQIHSYYYKGMDPTASRKKIEEDYKSSFYHMESSERSALHGIYKMASVGIEWNDKNSTEEFYKKVLSSEEGEIRQNFDNLVYLEHRSWSAYMLTHGHRRASLEDFRKYAYYEGNDWKDRRDPNHIKHPCLAACRPGRGLAEKVWMAPYLHTEELDPLDQASLWMHTETCRIAEKRKSTIKEIMKNISVLLRRQDHPQLEEAFRWLQAAVKKCCAKETNGEVIWNRALDAFKDACQKAEIYELKLKEETERLAVQMQPVLRVIKKHDFKILDEQIIRALPSLLDMEREGVSGRKILVKPVSKNPWENISGCLMLEPQKLILFSENESIDTDGYRKFLFDRGMEELVVSTRLSHLFGAKVYIDFTGTDQETQKRLLGHPQLKNASAFIVEKGRIYPIGNSQAEMFQKELSLTVDEALSLANMSASGRKYVFGKNDPKERTVASGFDRNQCRKLWECFVGEGNLRWKLLTETLKNIQDKNQWYVILEEEQEEESFTSMHLPEMLLEISGLKEVLKKCRQWGLISGLLMPKNNYDIPVCFRTSFRALGVELTELIRMAVQKPFQDHFMVEKTGDEKLKFRNETLYAEAEIPGEIVGEEKGQKLYLDRIVEEGLQKINESGGFELIQNLVSDSQKEAVYLGGSSLGSHISFRYATEAVREVLNEEKLIEKAMIYQECIRNGIFDDIRILPEISAEESGESFWQQADLIGVRKNKLFLICLEKDPLGQAAEESAFCKNFPMDVQVIRISDLSGALDGDDAAAALEEEILKFSAE